MPFCIFDRATGRYLRGARWDRRPHDTETQVELRLPAFPDRRTERWDGDQGVRPKTAEELEAYDAEVEEAAATIAVDGDKVRRLLFELNFDQENRLRAVEGKQPITKAQYRDALIARYKAL